MAINGQIHTRMFTITPTSTRTLTMPTAATIVADYSGTAVNDCFDFTIVNLAAATSTTTAVNTGGTLIGDVSTAGRTSSN